MKSVMTSLILIFIFPLCLFSQNFVDEEIETLAEKIGNIVDKKNNFAKKKKKVKSILIEDFTDTEGNVSKLGAMLAEEFTLALSNVGISFTVTGGQTLAEAPTKKNKLNIRKALQGATKIAEGVIDDSNYELNNKTRDAARSLEGAADIGTSIQSNKSRYKGIDAVVTGTLTESNDEYSILIKVISTKKGYAILANAKGSITKTPFILKLEDEENKRREAPSAGNDTFVSRGGGSTRGGSAIQNFASNQTTVDLLECKQVGQNIECLIRVTNNGPDLDYWIYAKGHDSRGFDSEGSYDYWATQVGIGSVIDNSRVKKTLITNNPVEAKITLGGVARDVSTLAKLQIKFHGHGGYFMVEYRDVRVD